MDAFEFGTPDSKHLSSVSNLLRTKPSNLIVGQLPLEMLTTKKRDVLQLVMTMVT